MAWSSVHDGWDLASHETIESRAEAGETARVLYVHAPGAPDVQEQ